MNIAELHKILLAAARANPHMLNGRFVSIPMRVRRADVIIHKGVRDAGDLGVIIVRHVLRRVTAGIGGDAPRHVGGLKVPWDDYNHYFEEMPWRDVKNLRPGVKHRDTETQRKPKQY